MSREGEWKKKFRLCCSRLASFDFFHPFFEVDLLASAGKTIVSELLMIKSILETKRKALFIEPYISIVQEKANYFRVSFTMKDF